MFVRPSDIHCPFRVKLDIRDLHEMLAVGLCEFRESRCTVLMGVNEVNSFQFM